MLEPACSGVGLAIDAWRSKYANFSRPLITIPCTRVKCAWAFPVATRCVPYDFAVGHPDASTFPSRALGEATTRMLLREGPDLALYPGDMSHDAARHLVSRKLKAPRGDRYPSQPHYDH